MKYLSAVGYVGGGGGGGHWTSFAKIFPFRYIDCYRMQIEDRDKQWKDYCELNLYFSDPIFQSISGRILMM